MRPSLRITWGLVVFMVRLTAGMCSPCKSMRWISLGLLCLHLGAASEDENIWNQLGQRNLVQVQQPPNPTPLDQRWRAFEDTYRLERPAHGGHYDAAIARPDSIVQHVGTSILVRIHYAAEPHVCGTMIEQHWHDLSAGITPHNLWRVHRMNEAAYGSTFFPLAYRHYMLTTDWERRHIHNGKKAIAVEIVWRGQSGDMRALLRPWMLETITTVGFLETIGLLQGCTMSHQCHITLNGHRVVTRRMHFEHGTYVLVDAYPHAIPEDTESESELPAPIALPDRDSLSSSTTSSSSSPSEVDQLFLDHAFITDTLVIHRPPGHITRPLRLIQPLQSTDPNNLVVVMQHWTDLRYHTWRLEGVHKTYEVEYPPSDDPHVFVLIAMIDLPSPLHQVLFTVVQTPHSMLQRAQITPPFVERDTILLLNRLDHYCQTMSSVCRVYLNSQLLPGGTRRSVTNGDYIRIILTTEPDAATEASLAQDFQVAQDEHGWEYIDEHVVNMFAADGAGQNTVIQALPRPTRGPNPQDHAEYWIITAILGHCMATYLLLQQGNQRVQGKCRRQIHRQICQPRTSNWWLPPPRTTGLGSFFPSRNLCVQPAARA